MTSPATPLQEIISSLADLRRRADGECLHELGDLIGLVLAAAEDAARRETSVDDDATEDVSLKLSPSSQS